MILKTCTPVGHGTLWWHLTSRPELADRLVVVLTANDLRKVDIRVSQGISWERTTLDLVRELQDSPALACLHRARHVILSFARGGRALDRTRGTELSRNLSCFSIRLTSNASGQPKWSVTAKPMATIRHLWQPWRVVHLAVTDCAGRTHCPGDSSRFDGDAGAPLDRPWARRSPPGGAPINSAFPSHTIAGILCDKPLAGIQPNLKLDVLGSFAETDVPVEGKSETWRILNQWTTLRGTAWQGCRSMGKPGGSLCWVLSS